ncbi:hypothetical protein IFM89_027410 [Coptis chinensis]|uniref:Peptidyl-prolyl cis-trans isomerase n=1 Tax=Coptis chinensis TaxID=261450 RepID=A0A835IBQ7_9MAGN|nr:hypothetical protein IFM89_027410 [Coptis chinensis]
MSEPIDKEWMSENERGGVVYSLGVEVGYHLISKGIEKSYRVWTFHGEDLSNAAVHPPLVANIGEKTSDDDGFEMGDTEEETIGDVGIGMRNFVDSAFGLHGDTVAGDDSLGIEFDDPYVPEPELGKRYYDYKKKATEKLYPTCEGPETTLSALVELHNVKKEFGWSGTDASSSDSSSDEDSPRELSYRTPAITQLASEYSECPSGKKGRDLGWFPRGERWRPFLDVAFKDYYWSYQSAPFKSKESRAFFLGNHVCPGVELLLA